MPVDIEKLADLVADKMMEKLFAKFNDFQQPTNEWNIQRIKNLINTDTVNQNSNEVDEHAINSSFHPNKDVFARKNQSQ